MSDQALPEQPSGDSGSLPLESRIANIFSPEPKAPQPREPQREAPREQEAPEVEASTDAGEEVETPQEETFEFEVEGERYLLPKKLEKAVLQEKDYTQKAQTLADQRRNIELKEQQIRTRELQQQFDSSVANEVRQLQMIDEVLKQPIDWKSMSTDEAFRHKLELDNLEKQKNQLREQLSQKYNEFQQQTRKEQQELLNKSLEVVKKRIPAWDANVAKSIREHAINEGYSEVELAQLYEPRHAITLWKAMQFDQLQAKATPAVTQARAVKTTSANPMPQATKDLLNYRKAIAKTQKGSPAHQQLVRDRVAKLFSR
jgi:hypothetical protein